VWVARRAHPGSIRLRGSNGKHEALLPGGLSREELKARYERLAPVYRGVLLNEPKVLDTLSEGDALYFLAVPARHIRRRLAASTSSSDRAGSSLQCSKGEMSECLDTPLVMAPKRLPDAPSGLGSRRSARTQMLSLEDPEAEASSGTAGTSERKPWCKFWA
jgi:hypothetical protein